MTVRWNWWQSTTVHVWLKLLQCYLFTMSTLRVCEREIDRDRVSERGVRTGAYLKVTDLPSYVRQAGGVVGHVSEHQPLLVVVFTQDLVLTQVKPVSNTEPTNTHYIHTLIQYVIYCRSNILSVLQTANLART